MSPIIVCMILAALNILCTGCPAAPLRAESGVGHSVTLPCSHVHASFNPEGRVRWTCTENQQWEGDLSSCTFNVQIKEILILSAVFNKSLANYDNTILLKQVPLKNMLITYLNSIIIIILLQILYITIQ